MHQMDSAQLEQSCRQSWECDGSREEIREWIWLRNGWEGRNGRPRCYAETRYRSRNASVRHHTGEGQNEYKQPPFSRWHNADILVPPCNCCNILGSYRQVRRR
jgi:hypothetical protein